MSNTKEQQTANTGDQYTLPLSAALESLWRRRTLAIILFLAVFSIAAAVTFVMPRKYQSHMKVLVKNARADLVVGPDSGPASAPRDVTEMQVNTEIELLGSTEILQSVVRSCRLVEQQSGAVMAAGSPTPASVERATQKLNSELSIQPIRKTNMIQVSYASTNPELAQRVLSDMADAYLNAHLAVHRSPGTYEFFRVQTERFRNELKESEADLSEFMKQNALASGDQTDLQIRSVMETEMLANEAERSYREQLLRSREAVEQMKNVQPRIKTQIRTLPNQYSVERLHSLGVELQNKRTMMASKFKPGDRILNELDEEIRTTQAAMERAAKLESTEEATDVNPIWQTLQGEQMKADLAVSAARNRVGSLQDQLKSYKTRMSGLEGARIRRDALERKVKESETGYLLYSKKQEEARITDLLDSQKFANVVVAEKPEVPHLPHSPQVGLNLGLGAVLATFISLGGVFVVEQMKPSGNAA